VYRQNTLGRLVMHAVGPGLGPVIIRGTRRGHGGTSAKPRESTASSSPSSSPYQPLTRPHPNRRVPSSSPPSAVWRETGARPTWSASA